VLKTVRAVMMQENENAKGHRAIMLRMLSVACSALSGKVTWWADHS
jgi:hypothetical protein